MALVNYSDSESDSESPIASAPASTTAATKAQAPKATFQKAATGKIKVDLPSIKPEPGQKEEESAEGRPAKRARVGGAFSGFNALLPAPKKTAQTGLKAGVSLKTSGEAAFSRDSRPNVPSDETYEQEDIQGVGESSTKTPAPVEEPKLVGKATKFLPLSVSNKKKQKKRPAANTPPPPAKRNSSAADGQHSTIAKAVTEKAAKEAEAIPKPKRSLFSMQSEEDAPPIKSNSAAYVPMTAQEGRAYLPDEISESAAVAQPAPIDPSSLEATANDLNLTPAQRRQLFGRKGGQGANVTQFNMDSEYAANEQLRQAGEVVEQRTVKAIAPGKHSLQQLVNNARTQQDAMEDKWAEGRRNQGGGQYSWRG